MVRARKRVHAIRRGPDGSAFQKCEGCGISVAIALADMHECGFKKNARKKLKSQCDKGHFQRQRMRDQPRSAFHFFMEEFIKTCIDGNEIEKNKKGCETWKNLSKEERRPFINQANKLNSAYVKLLLEEENEMQWVDDEADSAEVGKYDEDNEDDYEDSEMYYYDSESTSGSGVFLSETYDTLDTKTLYALGLLRNLLEDWKSLKNGPLLFGYDRCHNHGLKTLLFP